MFHGDNTSAKNNGQEREKKINSDIIRRYFKEEVAFKRVFQRGQKSKHTVMLGFLFLAIMELLDFSGPSH